MGQQVRLEGPGETDEEQEKRTADIATEDEGRPVDHYAAGEATH